MASCTSVFLVLALSGVVMAVDRVKMSQTPPTQPKFMLEKVMGKWYLQYRLASCSWSGSNGFDDWTVDQTIEGPESIVAVETWRPESGMCSSMATRKAYKGDAYFTVKDPIGDVLSGESYNVATDYKHFNIVWGCTKRSAGGKCDRPWVAVATRKKNPTPACLEIVKAILKKIWSLSLNEMRKISHENVC